MTWCSQKNLMWYAGAWCVGHNANVLFLLKWSFGVTCWEVFNLGRSPYPAMGPTEVVDFLDGGSRLKNRNNITCSETT